jgi:hypothetical protein
MQTFQPDSHFVGSVPIIMVWQRFHNSLQDKLAPLLFPEPLHPAVLHDKLFPEAENLTPTSSVFPPKYSALSTQPDEV